MKVNGLSVKCLKYYMIILVIISVSKQEIPDNQTTRSLDQQLQVLTTGSADGHDVLSTPISTEPPIQIPRIPTSDENQLTVQTPILFNVTSQENEDDTNRDNGSGDQEIQAEVTERTQIQILQDREIMNENDSDEEFKPIEAISNNRTESDTNITEKVISANTSQPRNTNDSSNTETMPFTIRSRLEQIGPIEDIVSIESSNSTDRKLAKYGILIEKTQEVTTHLTYTKLYVPVAIEIYYEETQKAAIILNETANSLMQATQQLKEYINQHINTNHTFIKIMTFCNIDTNMDMVIPGVNKEEQRVVCRAMTAMVTIGHLQDRTKELLYDTLYRINKIQEEIGRIKSYMPSDLQHKRNRRSMKYIYDTERTIVKRNVDEFDLISNSVSAIFGVATQSDVGQVRISLLEHNKAILEAVQTDEKFALILDVQSMQMINIATAVRNLQVTQSETTKFILSKTVSDNINELLKITHLNIAAAASTYTKVNNILTDISMKIKKVKDGFEAAIIGRLSIHTIDPATLLDMLTEFENTLKPHQKLLWSLHPADPTSYYKQISTNIEAGTENVNCMITFQIPIVEEKNKFLQYHITSLPFSLFENKSIFKTSMKGLPDSVDILISDTIINNNTAFYMVPEDSIEIYENNIAATLRTNKLRTLTSPQKHCITTLINKEIDEIPSRCGIESSSTRQKFLKVSYNSYIYFSNTPTTVIIRCPTTPRINGLQEHITAELRLKIQNFGIIRTDRRCDIITTTNKFIGDPITVNHKVIELEQTTDDRFTDFRTINISMWILILNQEQEMQVKDIKNIMKEIKTVTQEFQPELLQIISTRLREEVRSNIRNTKSTVQKAFDKIMEIGKNSGYIFIIQITMGVILVIIVVWIFSKMDGCLCKAKGYTIKQAKQTQRSTTEDRDLCEILDNKEHYTNEGIYKKLIRYADPTTEDESDEERPPMQFSSETTNNGMTTLYKKWSTNV